MMKVILNESKNARLYPFSINHLNYDLRVGAFLLKERLSYNNIQAIDYITDNALLREKYLLDKSNEKNYFANTLTIEDNLLLNNKLINLFKETTIYQTNTLINFKFNNLTIATYQPEIIESETIIEAPSETKFINYLWDAIDLNESQIIEDFSLFDENFDVQLWSSKYVACLGYPHIHIGDNVIIEPFVSLNTENGPIIIDKNAKIMSHSSLIGPCYIGENTIVKSGAKIYGNVSIGDYCKVGGEIEGSIFQGYSNKQHEGFLGHSFVGEWVNIGADTNTSDLKNTYGNIRVEFPNEKFDSKRMFLGTLFGDHSKIGINTMLNSGSTIGFSANVFGSGFPPKFIKSFSFGGFSDSDLVELESAIKTAELVMKRRNIQMSELDKEIFRTEYQKSRI